MQPKLLCLMVLLLVVTVAGCAPLVAGAGAGAGVYSYVTGELSRTYPVPFDQADAAVSNALDYLKITVIDTKTGDNKTVITAKQSDGTPVTVKLFTVSLDATEIRVRSGAVGYWNKDVSELIHASIAQRLR